MPTEEPPATAGRAAPTWTIGELARAVGCNVQTIRYYEQVGLLPRPARSAGNQRLYRKADAARLAFVRHARALGFGIADVRELLDLAERPDMDCAEADRIAQRHLAGVEARLARLGALQGELKRMIAQCQGGRIADCRVIEVLSEPAS